MKSKDPNHFKPYDWPQSGRPIRPYRLDPVAIAVDREDAEIQDSEQDSIDPMAQSYITEPMHAEIRKLRPGGGIGFSLFAMRFGLHEFFDWAVSETGQDWDSSGDFTQLVNLLERYETGYRHFTHEELEAAWNSLPGGVVLLQTRALSDAFEFAKRHAADDDPTLAMSGVLNRGWERDVFHIELGLDDDASGLPIIYEYPRNIWSRAWFELVEDLRQDRFPKTCARCGQDHIPRRRNRKYCSDTCRKRAYETRRSRDPERKKAQAARYLKRKEAAQNALSQMTKIEDQADEPDSDTEET